MDDLQDNKGRILGARIRAMREELGMTADALARVVSTSPKYIHALEDADYAVFGAKVYARGVLKRMLAVMASANTEDVIRLLDEAWDSQKKEEFLFDRSSAVRGPARYAGGRKRMYLTPVKAGIGAAAFVFIVFVSFAASRLIRFNGPPVLVVDEPSDEVALQEPMVWLKGRTERESKLTVNGREITINEQGVFGERIELQPGVTALIFTSENRFGKMSQVTRHIVVE